MQSAAPSEPGSPAHREHDTPSPKRRRQSERSTKTSTEQPEASNALSTDTPGRTLRRSPQRRGSSRESDMQRSSTPPETGTIRYTRTGRVSKATKGQRIHQCDECGKTYTRAEHLRRHQQNHKPGAFPCDIPGCGRSFYREDLLTRHKARHNDPLDPPTRRASIISQTSAPGAEPSMPAGVPPSSIPQTTSTERDTDDTPDELRPGVPTTTAQQSSSSRVPPRKGYIPITELPVAGQVPMSVNTGGPYSAYHSGSLWDPSPPYSPSGYDSPINDYTYASGPPYYGQRQLARARNESSVSFYGGYGLPNASRSPVSAGSSAGYMPQWGSSAQSPAFQHYSSSSSSEGAYGTGAYMSGDQHYFSLASVAEERDRMEFRDLLIPTTTAQGSSSDLTLDGIPFANEQRYLGAYWMWVHPLYSVVHKSTFSLENASPLLRAAMLALGAHMLQNSTDMANARIIHERCMKVLQKRNINNSHTFRVCDMQAIVLTEIYSIFKARRPPLQFSKMFVEAYGRLANDYHAFTQDTARPLHDSPMQTHTPQPGDTMDSLTQDAYIHLEATCKQRLLLTCYILDQQHATLFGRQQTSCMTTLGTNLPFPGSQQYWDALPGEKAEIRFQRLTSGTPGFDQIFQAMGAIPSMTEAAKDSHDAFRSSLMLACLIDSNNGPQVSGCTADNDSELSPILFAVEQSPRLRLSFYTYMLCNHTPMRDLMAVAGESWCMAEKLGSQAEYIQVQLTAKDWAKGSTNLSLDFALEQHEPPVQRAMHYALQILDIHRRHPKTGLLFQEWAIYLAAVVIWAKAYVNENKPRRKPRLSIPSPVEPRLSAHDLEQNVTALIDGGASTLGWNEAKSVLLWTKTKIEKVDMPHNCGLTNSALDVLGKLATRGNEDGWFG